MIGGVDGALICSRGQSRPVEAVWEDITGQPILEGYTSISDNVVLYKQIRANGIHLYRGGMEFTAEHEGVYACHIDDDAGNEQVLLIGIYTPGTVQNSGLPYIHTFSKFLDLTRVYYMYTFH